MKKSTPNLMNSIFWLLIILIDVTAKSCKPSESICLGNSLRICSEDGYWIETDCPTGHSCIKNQGSISCIKGNIKNKTGFDNMDDNDNDSNLNQDKKEKDESSTENSELDEIVEIDPSAENKKMKKTRTVTITKSLSKKRKSSQSQELRGGESEKKEKVPKEFQFEVLSQTQNGSKPVTYSLIFKKSPDSDNVFNQVIPNVTDANKKSQNNLDLKQNGIEAQTNNSMGSQQSNNQPPQQTEMMGNNMQPTPNGIASNTIPNQSSSPMNPQIQFNSPNVSGNQTDLSAQTNPTIPSSSSATYNQPAATQPSPSAQTNPSPSISAQTSSTPNLPATQPSQVESTPNPTAQSIPSLPATQPSQVESTPSPSPPVTQPSQVESNPSPPAQSAPSPSPPVTQPTPSPSPPTTPPTQSPTDNKPESKKTEQKEASTSPNKESGSTSPTNQKDSSKSSGQMITKEKLTKAMKECGYSPNPTYIEAIVEGVNKEFKDKEMVAMLLAQLAHESGGFQYIEEIACKNGCPGQYGTGAPGKSYHGRGFMQLSWPENYKKASEALGMGDKLYKNPELVSKDVKIAVKTSLYYWKSRVEKNPKVASKQSFGESTKEINGALECKGSNVDKSKKRYANYKIIAKVMEITKLAAESGCYN